MSAAASSLNVVQQISAVADGPPTAQVEQCLGQTVNPLLCFLDHPDGTVRAHAARTLSKLHAGYSKSEGWKTLDLRRARSVLTRTRSLIERGEPNTDSEELVSVLSKLVGEAPRTSPKNKILFYGGSLLILFLLLYIMNPKVALDVLGVLFSILSAVGEILGWVGVRAKEGLNEAALTIEKNLARNGIVDDTLGRLVKCDAAIVCDSAALSGAKNAQMAEIVNQMGELSVLKNPANSDANLFTYATCKNLCIPWQTSDASMKLFPESFHYPVPCLKFGEQLGIMDINKRITADGKHLVEKKFTGQLPQCKHAVTLDNPDVRDQLEQALRIFTKLNLQQIQKACEADFQLQYHAVAKAAIAQSPTSTGTSGDLDARARALSEEVPASSREHCKLFANLAVIGANQNRLLPLDELVEDDSPIDPFLLEAPGEIDETKKGAAVYEKCRSEKCKLDVTAKELQMKANTQYCTPQPHQQSLFGKLLPAGTRVWEVDGFCRSANKQTLKILAGALKAERNGPETVTTTTTTTGLPNPAKEL